MVGNASYTSSQGSGSPMEMLETTEEFAQGEGSALAMDVAIENKAANSVPRVFPIEMWGVVMEHLASKDLKELRLTCRMLGREGKILLFREPFVFRRDRMDIERYWQLMQDEVLSSRTKRIIFEIGAVYLEDIYENFAYRHEQINDTIDEEDAELLDAVESTKRRFIKDCARLLIHSKRCKQYFGYSKAMSTVFSGKPTFLGTRTLGSIQQLDRIDITLKSVPVSITSLPAWYDGDGNSYFRHISEEFRQILALIAKSPHRPKHISHDKLPVTFFTCQILALKSFAAPLSHLQTLHLTFDTTEPPIAAFWKGLQIFLASTSQLKNLRFGFDPNDQKQTLDEDYWFCRHEGEDSFNAKNAPEAWYVPLWKVFGEHIWQHLVNLRLDGMIFCQEGLSSLLYRHSKTLRVLELHSMGLWNGSFQGLLLGIRENLSLTDFGISGHCEAFHASHECWNFPHIYNPFEEVWCPDFISWTRMQKPEDKLGNRPTVPDPNLGSKMKDFIFNGGPWPIQKLHTVKSCTEFPRCVLHSPACADICMDETRAKNEGWEEDSGDGNIIRLWEIPSLNLKYFRSGHATRHDLLGYYLDGSIVEDEDFAWGSLSPTTHQGVRSEIRREIQHTIEEDDTYGPLDEDRKPVLLTQEVDDALVILEDLKIIRMTDPVMRQFSDNYLYTGSTYS